MSDEMVEQTADVHPPPVLRRQFTREQRSILVAWAQKAQGDGIRYLTEKQADDLAKLTSLSVKQVRIFMVNWRVRHKPAGQRQVYYQRLAAIPRPQHLLAVDQ